MEWIHASLAMILATKSFIDDGSTDSSWQIIEELNKQYPTIVKEFVSNTESQRPFKLALAA